MAIVTPNKENDVENICFLFQCTRDIVDDIMFLKNIVLVKCWLRNVWSYIRRHPFSKIEVIDINCMTNTFSRRVLVCFLRRLASISIGCW